MVFQKNWEKREKGNSRKKRQRDYYEEENIFLNYNDDVDIKKEEEYLVESDSDVDQPLQYQALPLDPSVEDPAFRYLVDVRNEAEKLPLYSTAKLQESFRIYHHTEANCPSWNFAFSENNKMKQPLFTPPEWIQVLIKKFFSWRRQIMEARPKHNSGRPNYSDAELHTLLYIENVGNILKFIASSLSQPHIIKLLRLHLLWIKPNSFNEFQAKIIFTLLLNVDTLLDADDASVLRDLIRLLYEIRNDNNFEWIDALVVILCFGFNNQDIYNNTQCQEIPCEI
jgi:hypothetical protein